MSLSENITFTQRDEFNRKLIAENLVHLLDSKLNLSPMVINGGWGIGKTEFCLKTIKLIEDKLEDKYHLVYIDAFKSDHSGEPLIAILSEIINVCKPNEEQINRLGKLAAGLFKFIVKASVGYLLRSNTNDITEEFSDAIKTTTDSAVEKSVSYLLKEQANLNKNINLLKELLKEISGDKEIIIFIDELDRCRPDYALDMLEVIKHILDIEKIKVVLVTNIEQLKSAVTQRYGTTIDAHRYLDKLFKFTFKLPSTVVGNYYSELAAYNLFLSKLRQSDNDFFTMLSLDDTTLDFIKDLIEIHNVSLREVEKVIHFLDVYLIIGEIESSKQDYMRNMIIIFCIFLSVLKPKLLDDFLNSRVNQQELLEFLNLKLNKEIFENGIRRELLIYVISAGHFYEAKLDIRFDLSNNQNWNEFINGLSSWHDYRINLSTYEVRNRFGMLSKTLNILSLYS